MLCNTVFANRNHTGSEESAAKGENSSAQWACDEDTHRVDRNYKETRIKKRCFSLFSQQVSPELAEPCLKLRCLTCFSAHFKPEKKEEGCVRAKWRKRNLPPPLQEPTEHHQGLRSLSFPPICSLPSSAVFLPLWRVLLRDDSFTIWEVKIAFTKHCNCRH